LKMDNIKIIYCKLLKAYGPQGWWPLTVKHRFTPKHRGEKPDTEKRKFEIILGAILTQNTAWTNVEKAIANLNKKKLLSKEKIRKLPEKRLAELIRPSGYYNQKARKIKAMVKFLDSKKPLSRKNLLKVWGIGPETADSILLYAYEQPFFVIDAYTGRVFTRLGLAKNNIEYEELQRMFHRKLPRNVKMYKEYHALIVEHCKRFCMKKPLCKECVIRNLCECWKNRKNL
jgi:endonuclease-3 related protein